MAGQWTEQLYAHLNKNPFQKKILITNGFAQGHQWLEQACRSYGPLMNTEVQTVESLVLASVKHELAMRQLRYVADGETFWIVQHVLEQLTTVDESYLPQTMLTPGVIHSFHKALTELRNAGVTGAELQSESFDSVAKGLFIKNLLMSYEALLVTRRFVDFSGLLPIVNQVNHTQHVLIYSEHLQLTYVEQKMLVKLSANEPIILPAEISFVEEQSEFPLETTAFFHATSVLAEVREVFRRLAENGLSGMKLR